MITRQTYRVIELAKYSGNVSKLYLMVPPYRGAVDPKRFDHPTLGAVALWLLNYPHHSAVVLWRSDCPARLRRPIAIRPFPCIAVVRPRRRGEMVEARNADNVAREIVPAATSSDDGDVRGLVEAPWDDGAARDSRSATGRRRRGGDR